MGAKAVGIVQKKNEVREASSLLGGENGSQYIVYKLGYIHEYSLQAG